MELVRTEDQMVEGLKTGLIFSLPTDMCGVFGLQSRLWGHEYPNRTGDIGKFWCLPQFHHVVNFENGL